MLIEREGPRVRNSKWVEQLPNQPFASQFVIAADSLDCNSLPEYSVSLSIL